MRDPSLPPSSSFATLVDLARGRAADSPDSPLFLFLEDGETEGPSWTRGDLDTRACALAARLQSLGAAPGERALLLFPPGLEFIGAFFGCLYAGVVAVPAYPPRPGRARHRGDGNARLAALACDAAPRFVLTVESLTAAVRSLAAEVPALADAAWIAVDEVPADLSDAWRPPAVSADSVAFLQYTSGSTALPKGVVVTHGNLLHNEEMIRRAFGQSESSVVAGWLPLYHDMGLIGNVLQPLYCGGRCVLMSPVAFLKRPARWLEAISKYGATTGGGPDFAYELCVQKVAPEARAGLDLSRWRVAFNGAEPVHAATLERFAGAFGPCGFDARAFFPCYGLAEATLFVAGGTVGGGAVARSFAARGLEEGRAEIAVASEPARPLVSCGGASLGQQIAIVDPETGERLAEGRIGEIWISGPSVAGGYWGKPETTAEAFGAYLEGSGPFLRTGDLGFVYEGGLFISGRLKDLVILRGRNHHPQDLERTAEGAHPGLRPGGSAAFSIDEGGEERLVLVAEVERSSAAALSQIAAAVRTALAAEDEVQLYELVAIPPGALPKTSSGKVRRRDCRSDYLEGRLAAVGRSGVGASPLRSSSPGMGEGEAPSLPGRIALAAAVACRVPEAAVPLDRPLAELGIDSLAALELQHALEGELGVTVEISAILAGATPEEIAAGIEAGRVREAVLPGGSEAAAGALSFGQRALWFVDRLSPESAVYNLAAAARTAGALDPAALEAACFELAARHPALRTTFTAPAGKPFQVVHDRLEPDFAVIDAAGWSEEQLVAALDREAARPFDLERGPLWRLRLATVAPGEHALLLAVHHLIADFWSIVLLLADLEALYRARTGGDEAAPPPAASYADFVAWQRRLAGSERGAVLETYWRGRLATPLPRLELPWDRPRPAVQSFAGDSSPLALPRALSDGLEVLGRSAGSTLFMLLLAAYEVLLHRASGQPEVLVGSPTSGRASPSFAPVIGYFVNPVVMRADLAGDPGFADHLARVRETALGSFEHQDYPFALAAERLAPERDPSRPPVFQTLFALQKAHLAPLAGLATLAIGEGGGSFPWAGLTLTGLRLGFHPAPFDLSLWLTAGEEGLAGSFQFATALLDRTTVERMAGHFAALLAGIVADPERRVGDLPLLSEAERGQIAQWNQTFVEAPAEPFVHRQIEAQAVKTPAVRAVVAGEESLTYEELEARAEALAERLRARGLEPEGRVGVCLGRGLSLPVALLGILKAGGAYVPLDSAYPRERLDTILEDAGIELLVTETRWARLLGRQGTAVVCLDGGGPHPDPLPSTSGEGAPARFASGGARVPLSRLGRGARGEGPGADPDTLAYLIYTSGSTGRPKGVMVSHANVTNFFAGMDRHLGRAAPGTWLAVTSISFDISVLELLWTLCRGFTVVLQPGEAADPAVSSPQPVDFSLFYFASDESGDGAAAPGGKYRLLLEGARFADRHGFAAVWTPERHFHAFGGLYPNPSVTGAAVAAVTSRVAVRAGSVVLPLHNTLRVAEEWAVVDNLSGGRAGLSLASGWNAADFVFAPENFRRRKELLREEIDRLRALWRGAAVRVPGGDGEVEVRVLPRPVQAELPLWLTAAGSAETFRLAGELGMGLLTHLLGQSTADLAAKIAVYREAWSAAGHAGTGHVVLMLHTFVGPDAETVRATVREPFTRYLASSLDLMAVLAPGQDLAAFTEEDHRLLLDRAFERYFATSGLFGTPDECLRRVDRLAGLGVDEIACLIDFGIGFAETMAGLERLAEVQERRREAVAALSAGGASVPRLAARHGVTHLQCTPSAARMLLADPETPAALGRLEALLLGGEALPPALAGRLVPHLSGSLLNLYGPTETTIWSSVDRIDRAGDPSVTLGRPIANTALQVLDGRFQPVPVGQPGELWIGGAGVTRGYLGRPELTAERFVPDPWGNSGGRLYRTGDLVRRLPDGRLAFLGRVDHQIKLRGHRIELGEIEAALAAHPGVHEAVVVARAGVEGDAGTDRLVAYVVPADPAALALSQLAGRATPERLDTVLAEASRHRLPNGFWVAQLSDAQTQALYQEVFEQEIYLRHGIAVPEGAVVFDVGANIGLFSLFVGSRFPGARLYSFEPIAPTFRTLARNVELYGLPARTFEIGLSDREEEAELTFYPLMAGLSGRFADDDRDVTRAILSRWLADQARAGRIAVPAGAEIDAVVDLYLESETHLCRLRPLSAVLAEQGIERVDLLKIDVEKSEVRVLEGIADADWPKIRQVVIEVHSRELLAAVAAILERQGFALAVDEFIPVGEGGERVYMLYAVRPGERPPAAAEAVLPLSEADLRSHLGGRLPAPWVPGAFVFLPALPLTPNGKVDRKALPVPEEQRRASAPRVAPETEAQQAVARVWQKLLGRDGFGIHDNFFEVGGNSLLLVEAHALLRAETGREVLLVELMRHPTIDALARHLSESAGEAGGTAALAEKAQDRGRSQRQALGRQKALARGRAGRREGEEV